MIRQARSAAEGLLFANGVFAQARKAKIWSHIDLETAARALEAPRDRLLVRALDYLAEVEMAPMTLDVI